ncbi:MULTISPECIES: helix-turn-helix domain-containing protein [Thiorhodovibrio]|uniref:helix-turn-helix domain-containing protein n=1 Tax=Thiorhodovibrio TaxID=61593 RepID=UPI0019144D3B|nr:MULTISPECIES: helix-turn-helix domain-containing protein [Thiorhodovibrio]
MSSNTAPATSPQPRGGPRPQIWQPERHALIDASQAADEQTWMSEFNCRQLSAGRFSGLLERVDLDGIEIVREHQSQDIHKVGVMPPGTCTVSLIDHTAGKARFSQFAADVADQLFFMPGDTVFDAVVPGGISTRYVRLDQAALLKGLAALDEPLAERLANGGGLQSLGLAGRVPFQLSLRALNSIARDPRTGHRGASVQALRRNLLELVLLTVSAADEVIPSNHPSLHARRRGLHIVRGAQAYMEEQLALGANPSLVDLCLHTGVSARTLQYAFHDQLGLTPNTYLRLLRLNGARAELVATTAAGTSVTQIATRWGFMHLGRFARAYRELYKEPPSATLAR